MITITILNNVCNTRYRSQDLNERKKINFFTDHRLLSNCVTPRRHTNGCNDLPSVGKSSITFVSPRQCASSWLWHNINQGVFSLTTKISLLHQGLCTALDTQTYVDQPWPAEPDWLRDRWTVVRFDGTIRNFPAHAPVSACLAHFDFKCSLSD